MYSSFDVTWVLTYDFWVMNSTFHVPETFVLITEPSIASPNDHLQYLITWVRQPVQIGVSSLLDWYETAN